MVERADWNYETPAKSREPEQSFHNDGVREVYWTGSGYGVRTIVTRQPIDNQSHTTEELAIAALRKSSGAQAFPAANGATAVTVVPVHPGVPADIVQELNENALAEARPGQAVTVPSNIGISPELRRELTNSAEGFEANLASLQQTARVWTAAFTDNPDRFIKSFDTLPVGIQGKCLAALRHNPGLSPEELRDKIKRRLTLDEAAAFDGWMKKLRIN